MNLANKISFLLYKHSCVILPGFGAFLVNEKDAECNEIAKYATPRQKVVSFNRQIVNNDGLLANHISIQYGCSYDLGVTHINDYIQSLWDVLNVKRNVEIPEIGTFYFTAEKKLVFVPYLSVNFDTASFGLPKLRLKTIEHTTTANTPAVAQPTPTILHIPATAEKTVVAKKETIRVKPIRKVERNKKNIALQNKKVEHNTKASKTRKGISTLSVVNILGSLFLVALIFTMFNFERGAQQTSVNNLEIASLLDSPVTVKSSKSNVTHLVSYGIYAEVATIKEATNLTEKLLVKYNTAEMTVNDSGSTEVFIISFTNESLANEYKSLLQNKLNQKLVIKQK
jgi:nucleoid DNA-binding protein